MTLTDMPLCQAFIDQAICILEYGLRVDHGIEVTDSRLEVDENDDNDIWHIQYACMYQGQWVLKSWDQDKSTNLIDPQWMLAITDKMVEEGILT